MAGAFEESQHPRGDGGKFATGSGGGVKKAAASAGAAKASARSGAVKTESIDKAYVHVARGEHAKAHAIFAKHGVEIQDNVKAIGKSQGYDYSKPPPQAVKAAAKVVGGGKSADLTRAKKVAEFAASDSRRKLDATVNSDLTDGKHHRQLTQESQAAVRGHLADLAGKYGMPNRDAGLSQGHVVEVRDGGKMGNAEALHYTSSGKVVMSDHIATQLYEHGQTEPKAFGRDYMNGDDHGGKMNAYRVAVHEQIHGHGPLVHYAGHGVMLEEMTTEMSARKVAADVHGIHVADMSSAGAYHKYVDSVATKMADLAGHLDTRPAHEALARATIEFKQGAMPVGHDQVSNALYQIGKAALGYLGHRKESGAIALHDHMMAIAGDE